MAFHWTIFITIQIQLVLSNQDYLLLSSYKSSEQLELYQFELDRSVNEATWNKIIDTALHMSEKIWSTNRLAQICVVTYGSTATIETEFISEPSILRSALIKDFTFESSMKDNAGIQKSNPRVNLFPLKCVRLTASLWEGSYINLFLFGAVFLFGYILFLIVRRSDLDQRLRLIIFFFSVLLFFVFIKWHFASYILSINTEVNDKGKCTFNAPKHFNNVEDAIVELGIFQCDSSFCVELNVHADLNLGSNIPVKIHIISTGLTIPKGLMFKISEVTELTETYFFPTTFELEEDIPSGKAKILYKYIKKKENNNILPCTAFKLELLSKQDGNVFCPQIYPLPLYLFKSIFDTFVSNWKEIRILLLGPAGVGKSTLINSWLEATGKKKLVKTGESTEHVTTEVSSVIWKTKNSTVLRIWDTIGITSDEDFWNDFTIEAALNGSFPNDWNKDTVLTKDHLRKAHPIQSLLFVLNRGIFFDSTLKNAILKFYKKSRDIGLEPIIALTHLDSDAVSRQKLIEDFKKLFTSPIYMIDYKEPQTCNEYRSALVVFEKLLKEANTYHERLCNKIMANADQVTSCVLHDPNICLTDTHNCNLLATCNFDGPGKHSCLCPLGYSGDGVGPTGCQSICSSNSHGCEHICQPSLSSLSGYICSCKEGYKIKQDYPELCEEVDPCVTGNHLCHEKAICIVLESPALYKCECPTGYLGDGLGTEGCTFMISWIIYYTSPILALIATTVFFAKLFTRQVHGRQVPGGQVPGGQVPGGQVPGEQVPGRQVPGEQAPGEQVPGEQVPGGQVPGRQVPGGQVPGRQVPGGQVPGRQVPGGQVPGGQVPGPVCGNECKTLEN